MKLTREEKIAELNKIAKPVKENSKWIEIAKWNEEHADALEDYMIIAQRILKTLKEKKMTQRELAKQLDVTPQALTRIMKGRQNLSLNKVRKIERVLGITLMTINRIDGSQSQLRTEMVPVSLHYNITTTLFQGSINNLKKSGKRESEKNIGNLRIAS
jgi:ribosome-binding protein aMBF1 (putative translation factor)